MNYLSEELSIKVTSALKALRALALYGIDCRTVRYGLELAGLYLLALLVTRI
jgi:hypothetical protein